MFESFLGISFLDKNAGMLIAGIGTAGQAISMLAAVPSHRQLVAALKTFPKATCIVLATRRKLRNVPIEPRLEGKTERELLNEFRQDNEQQAEVVRRLRRAHPKTPLIVRNPQQFQRLMNGSRTNLPLAFLYNVGPRTHWKSVVEACLSAELAFQHIRGTYIWPGVTKSVSREEPT